MGLEDGETLLITPRYVDYAPARAAKYADTVAIKGSRDEKVWLPLDVVARLLELNVITLNGNATARNYAGQQITVPAYRVTAPRDLVIRREGPTYTVELAAPGSSAPMPAAGAPAATGAVRLRELVTLYRVIHKRLAGLCEDANAHAAAAATVYIQACREGLVLPLPPAPAAPAPPPPPPPPAADPLDAEDFPDDPNVPY